MHELSVTESILKIALDAAGSRRVTAINLVIGELNGIVDDSVQFYFDLLSRNTTAEGAELRFERRQATASCAACGHSYHPGMPLLLACPSCGNPKVIISGGREMRVDSIEVSDDAGNPD